ncbi:uncharacterized protein BROUX77_005249 [Berkeleyomyces rouxiae]|uniref:uncharacterized protein n=1 Tax=Berkeleyomyces rouxiae TaxID=2035830 RepID=UPI003B7BC217
MSSNRHPALPVSALEPLTAGELDELQMSSQRLREIHTARRQRQRVAGSTRPPNALVPLYSHSISHLPHRSSPGNPSAPARPATSPHDAAGSTEAGPAHHQPPGCAARDTAVRFAVTAQLRMFAAEATPAALACAPAECEPLRDEPRARSDAHVEALVIAQEDREALAALLREFVNSPPGEDEADAGSVGENVSCPPGMERELVGDMDEKSETRGVDSGAGGCPVVEGSQVPTIDEPSAPGIIPIVDSDRDTPRSVLAAVEQQVESDLESTRNQTSTSTFTSAPTVPVLPGYTDLAIRPRTQTEAAMVQGDYTRRRWRRPRRLANWWIRVQSVLRRPR